jgi:glycosyltransferase involved in cell wall biosynthesis
MSERPEISAVVCTYNGSSRIGRTVRSLVRQTLAPDRFEVIVVDDGSRDGSGEVAAAAGATVITLEHNQGLPGARNAGVGAARAPLIAFTDDDCEADAEWLERLLEALNTTGAEGIGGRVIAGPGPGLVISFLAARNPVRPTEARLLVSDNPTYRLALYARLVAFGPPELTVGAELYSAVGANMAIRRSVLEEIGGFDGRVPGAEEEDMWRRARARPQGVVIRYEPRAVIVHHFEPDLSSSLRRARGYGRGHARLVAAHPDVRPIVFPSPLLAAALIAHAAIAPSYKRVARAMLAPLLTYPRWLADAARERSLRPLAYPYLELAQEAEHMGGQFLLRR